MDAHKVIAEMKEVIKLELHIVDGVKTLAKTNEFKHGEKLGLMGCLLAGIDPVSLDVLGLELLRWIEPRLRCKLFNDVLHLRYAIELSVGDARYEIVEW